MTRDMFAVSYKKDRKSNALRNAALDFFVYKEIEKIKRMYFNVNQKRCNILHYL